MRAGLGVDAVFADVVFFAEHDENAIKHAVTKNSKDVCVMILKTFFKSTQIMLTAPRARIQGV
jgi:hypothetical protein